MHETEYKWAGENKAISRTEKIEYLLNAVHFDNPVCLTMPGSKPEFERLLVEHGIAKPDNIVGVQHDKIWKKSSGEVYDNGLTTLTSLRPLAKELGIRVYARELHLILKTLFPQYKNNPEQYPRKICHRSVLAKGVNIVDYDTTYSIGERMTSILRETFRSGILAKESVIFINNVRDRHGGKRTQYRMGAILKEAGLDFAAECTKNVKSDDAGNELRRAAFALVAVPSYYSCIAFGAGYDLALEGITQYRDRRGWMVQYFFNCEEGGSWVLEGRPFVADTCQTMGKLILKEWLKSKGNEMLGNSHYQGQVYSRYNKVSKSDNMAAVTKELSNSWG